MWGLIALYCVVGLAVLFSSFVISKIMWGRLRWWKRPLFAAGLVTGWPLVFFLAVVIAHDDRRRAKNHRH